MNNAVHAYISSCFILAYHVPTANYDVSLRIALYIDFALSDNKRQVPNALSHDQNSLINISMFQLVLSVKVNLFMAGGS